MNVGVVSILYPTIRQPGLGIYVKDQLDRLSTQCSVKCLSPIPFHMSWGEPRHLIADAGYPVRRPRTLPFPRWFMQPMYASSMAFTLGAYGRGFFDDCDLIHSHFGFPDVAAAAKTFRGKLPLVATVHGSDLNIIAKKPGPRRRIVEGLNACETVICVSNALFDRCRELGVTTPLEVIPNGVDTTLFSPGDKQVARKEVGVDHEGPLIIFAGNFVPVKGIKYLILSLPGVLAKFPDCRATLIGADPNDSVAREYQVLADSIGVGGALTILPKADHERLRHWMRASDMLVLPSVAEGFGLVAAEALACGRPVVSTRCGGPEDIVTERAGRLVPVGDPDALAQGMIEVLSGDEIDPPERLAASVAARFSWDSVTERIMDLYRKVTG